MEKCFFIFFFQGTMYCYCKTSLCNNPDSKLSDPAMEVEQDRDEEDDAHIDEEEEGEESSLTDDEDEYYYYDDPEEGSGWDYDDDPVYHDPEPPGPTRPPYDPTEEEKKLQEEYE